MSDLPPPPGDNGHGVPDHGPPRASDAYVPDAVEAVRRTYPEVGAAETARRLGMAYDDVRAIARELGFTHREYLRDVEDARARLDERRRLRDVRRLELQETLLLGTERAVTRFIAEAERGKASNLRDASSAVRAAYAELRLEEGGREGDAPAAETDLERRTLELRDELAERRRRRAAGE